MEIKDYIVKARSTALYPDLGSNIYYPALGLAGECGEVFEKVYFDAEPCEIIKELGDVTWYCANVAVELNISIGSFEVSDASSALDLCGFIQISKGRICEAIKKTMRDTDGVMTDERIDLVAVELETIMSYVHAIALKYDSDLKDVMETNIVKLYSRKNRGTLKGDGDNR